MEDATDRICQEGTARWPQVLLPSDSLARRVRQSTAAAEIGYPAELYLAWGCAEGVPTAISVFEREFLAEVDSFVARIDSSRAFADEVKQRLRERLLVGPAARISDYRGDGPLGGWLRVASLRIAIDLARANGGRRMEPIGETAARALDPELRLVRAEHRVLVEGALRDAVARLTPRQRNILRLHFVSAWSFARIARSYRVHRATVMRWIEGIRQQLLDDLLATVGGQLALDPDQLRSLLGVLRSQVDASLSGMAAEL
jgi:RNA polymerase sigma-70 factor (ECF subfamily)